MENKTANKSLNITKIALIASLLLNIAFIGGFAFKKYLSAHHGYSGHEAQSHEETTASKNIHPAHETQVTQPLPCENSANKVGYRHLCTRSPKFKEIFHSHSEQYQKALNELTKLKKEFLDELKKENFDREAAEKLLLEVNRRSTELNENNYRHLLSVKELLDPDDFANLLECMTRTLCTYKDKEMPMDMANIPCKEEEKK